MALKPVVSQEEFSQLPEAIKGEYAEKDGQYRISIEGLVSEADLIAERKKVNEFRENNNILMKAIGGRDGKSLLESLQEIRSKLDGINPEEYRALKDKEEALKKRGVNAPEDVEAQVARAIKPLQDRIQRQDEERARLTEQTTMNDFDKQVAEQARKAGHNPVFFPDIIERAHKVFKYSDGKIVAKDGDGLAYDDKGSPLSVEAWTTTIPKEFLLPSSGGGALHGTGGAPRPTKFDGKFRSSDGSELKVDGITTL